MGWKTWSSVVASATVLAGCQLLGGGGIRIGGERLFVPAASDGAPLTVYELKLMDDATKLNERRAVLFYVQGSEPNSVLDRIGQLAGAATFNVLVVVMERRGVGEDGQVDERMHDEYSTRQQRVSDHGSVLDHYLARLDDRVAVVLMGGSEGGIIAAELAKTRPRVTHLALIGSGGGWTQADEFRFFLQEQGSYLGVSSLAQLEQQFADIEGDPDAVNRSWAGHTFRHWSSFLWYSPVGALAELDVPILLMHGTRDEAVPVESARALRDVFRERGKANLTYREYEGLDHSLRDASGKSGFPLLEVDMVQWFAATGLLSVKEGQLFEARVRRNHPDLF